MSDKKIMRILNVKLDRRLEFEQSDFQFIFFFRIQTLTF